MSFKFLFQWYFDSSSRVNRYYWTHLKPCWNSTFCGQRLFSYRHETQCHRICNPMRSKHMEIVACGRFRVCFYSGDSETVLVLHEATSQTLEMPPWLSGLAWVIDRSDWLAFCFYLSPEFPVCLDSRWFPLPRSSSPESNTSERPITSHTCPRKRREG